MMTIEQAKELSKRLHAGQARRGIDNAYWKHPVAVHETLIERFPCINHDAQVAALLMDAVSEHRITTGMLRKEGVTDVALGYIKELVRHEGESDRKHFGRIFLAQQFEVNAIKWAQCKVNSTWTEQEKLSNTRSSHEASRDLGRMILLNQGCLMGKGEFKSPRTTTATVTVPGLAPVIIDTPAAGWDIEAWQRSFRPDTNAPQLTDIGASDHAGDES